SQPLSYSRLRRPPRSPLFPYTTLFRSIKAEACDHMNLGGGMVDFIRNAAMAGAAGMLCWHGSGVDLGIMEHSIPAAPAMAALRRSEEHTSELQSRGHLVCRLLLEKKKN